MIETSKLISHMYTHVYINVTNEQCTCHSCEFSVSTILNSIARVHTHSRNFYAKWNILSYTVFKDRVSRSVNIEQI